MAGSIMTRSGCLNGSGRVSSPTRYVPTITVNTTAPNHRKIFKKRLRGNCSLSLAPPALAGGSIFCLSGACLCVDVTNTTNRFDPFEETTLMAQFFAQIADMHVYAAIERRGATAQHIFRQLLAGDDSPGRAQ